MHVSESPEGDSRPFGSTYVHLRLFGLDLETRIGSRMKNTDGGKSEADDKTEKSRRNGWLSNATFKSQV